jgi:archaellum component FlaF (FlaF/FlaG flagellin family)
MDIIGNVGVNMGTQYLQEGENTVTVPTVAGIYLLHLTTEDGNQYVQKIIVY